MERKAWVYKITSPSGKIYIGSTVNIKNRISKYKYAKCSQQTKLYASLIKYGFDKHKFEVICECDTSDMFIKKAYYGALFNSLSRKNGLNLQLPKDGDKYSWWVYKK